MCCIIIIDCDQPIFAFGNLEFEIVKDIMSQHIVITSGSYCCTLVPGCSKPVLVTKQVLWDMTATTCSTWGTSFSGSLERFLHCIGSVISTVEASYKGTGPHLIKKCWLWNHLKQHGKIRKKIEKSIRPSKLNLKITSTFIVIWHWNLSH